MLDESLNSPAWLIDWLQASQAPNHTPPLSVLKSYQAWEIVRGKSFNNLSSQSLTRLKPYKVKTYTIQRSEEVGALTCANEYSRQM